MLTFQNIFANVLILTVLISACVGQSDTNSTKQNCSMCTLQYRCSPYYNEPVWSIVDGPKCLIFKNGCIFSNQNCQRKNNCLRPLIATDKDSCKQHCPTCTGVAKVAVCGVFAFVAPNGTNSEEYINFENTCELEKYACNNEKAYFYYNNGAC